MSKKLFWPAVFIFLCPAPSRAAFEGREIGARAVGLSGAYTALAEDAYAPYFNPAGLGHLEEPAASMFYSRAFSMKELTLSGISVACPSSAGAMDFAISQFGSGIYREQELIFSHGFKPFPRLALGYSLKGYFVNIRDFGSTEVFGLDLGSRFVTRKLVLSLTAKNVTGSSFGIQKEAIASVWTGGLSYKLMPGLLFALDLEGLGSDLKVKSGMEFEVSPAFVLRGGLQNGPSRFSGGLRVRRAWLSLDYAYQHHPYLPGSHYFGVNFGWDIPEIPEAGRDGNLPTESPGGRNAKAYRFDAKVDILRAKEEDLLQIPGIGPFTAKKIIAYRDQVGINSVDDLLNIPGISKRMFLILKDSCIAD